LFDGFLLAVSYSLRLFITLYKITSEAPLNAFNPSFRQLLAAPPLKSSNTYLFTFLAASRHLLGAQEGDARPQSGRAAACKLSDSFCGAYFRLSDNLIASGGLLSLKLLPDYRFPVKYAEESIG
jgi:hypothetical protein